jgi:16S rRNA (guanine527-N7)-methyltransferase
MPDLEAAEPAEFLAPYNVSRESMARLSDYVNLLLKWQKTMNLVGASTVGDVWRRHIQDAVQLTRFLSPPCAVADLGSGAGIPGLVLALLDGFEAHLYESNGRKAAFLREAIRLTGARAVVHEGRLEDLGRGQGLPLADWVISRALAPLPKLLGYAEPFLAGCAGCLFHKGQDVDAELTQATKYWRFLATKHPSDCDSRGVILELREVRRG